MIWIDSLTGTWPHFTSLIIEACCDPNSLESRDPAHLGPLLEDGQMVAICGWAQRTEDKSGVQESVPHVGPKEREESCCRNLDSIQDIRHCTGPG